MSKAIDAKSENSPQFYVGAHPKLPRWYFSISKKFRCDI